MKRHTVVSLAHLSLIFVVVCVTSLQATFAHLLGELGLMSMWGLGLFVLATLLYAWADQGIVDSTRILKNLGLSFLISMVTLGSLALAGTQGRTIAENWVVWAAILPCYVSLVVTALRAEPPKEEEPPRSRKRGANGVSSVLL